MPDQKQLKGGKVCLALSLRGTVHLGGEGIAIGGSSTSTVVGAYCWVFPPPHIFVEEDAGSRQEERLG